MEEFVSCRCKRGMSQGYFVTVAQLNGETMVCQMTTDSCVKDLKIEILRSLELDFSQYACDLVCGCMALTDEDSLVSDVKLGIVRGAREVGWAETSGLRAAREKWKGKDSQNLLMAGPLLPQWVLEVQRIHSSRHEPHSAAEQRILTVAL